MKWNEVKHKLRSENDVIAIKVGGLPERGTASALVFYHAGQKPLLKSIAW